MTGPPPTVTGRRCFSPPHGPTCWRFDREHLMSRDLVRGWELRYTNHVADDYGVPVDTHEAFATLGEAKARAAELFHVKAWDTDSPNRIFRAVPLGPRRCLPRTAADFLAAADGAYLGLVSTWASGVPDRWCPAVFSDWLRDRDMPGQADAAAWAYAQTNRIGFAVDHHVPVSPDTLLSPFGWGVAVRRDTPPMSYEIPVDVHEMLKVACTLSAETPDPFLNSVTWFLDAWALARPG